ncbi:hypothetical protein ACHAP5_008740 [Fusarium lateritium]
MTKSRRITQACDFCHRRGLKCRTAENLALLNSKSPCQTCLEFGEVCTRNRVAKKRGTKQRDASSLVIFSGHARAQEPPGSFLAKDLDPLGSEDCPSSAKTLTSKKVINELLDVYLDTVHPMFPFFCERELRVGWRDGSFPATSSDYMNLVSIDGEPTEDTSDLAQTYLNKAEALVTDSAETAGEVELIRSYGFLALVGAQSGNRALLHKYLGLFHTISSRSNFHDEANWPTNTSDCDKEVRRRLWWAMYRLEVHTACMFGTLIRCSETQCDVGYPSGLHHPAFVAGRDGQFEDWFSGWNLTTDLYRLLEHAVMNLRFRRRKQKSIIQDYSGPDISQVMMKLSELQDQILPQFGSAASRSSDSGRNRYGFQACNILCTIHFTRMMVSLASHQDIQVACQAVQEMMQNMNSIPHEYIRATGSPLLQQLAGVGHMLLSTAKKSLSISLHYSTFRDTMGLIMVFLARFGELNSLAMKAKERLLAEVEDFERRAKNLELNGGLEIGLPVDFNMLESMVDFDMALFDGALDDQDFMNANLLKGFGWQDPSGNIL